MSQKNFQPIPDTSNSSNNLFSFIKVIFTGLMVGLLVLMASVAFFLFIHSPISSFLSNTANSLFALSTTQEMWYITRAAGIMAYLLLWMSTAWGLAVASKVFDNLLHRSFTYDFHEFISLLAIGFLVLHIVVLMADKYLPYTLAEILVPFLSPYRPVWVGIGVIAFYLSVLVTVTFYLKTKIGMRAFRTIHVLSLVGYLGATLHGFFAGTDSPLYMTILMYAGSFLVIVFLFTYWLIGALQKKASRNRPSTTTLGANQISVRR